jgi:hypothetical protein
MTEGPNYIKIMNWFWDTVPYLEGYKSTHATLFFATVDSINRNKWGATSLPYEYIVNKCRIGKRVYLEGREWLIDNKLIEMTAGKNAFQMARFQLGIAVLNDTAIDTPTHEVAVSNDTANSTTTTPLTAPINKHKTYKQKTSDSELNISFDFFWDLYDKKVGDKEVLVKKWVGLTDEDRRLIVDYIPKYKEAEPNKKFRKDPKTFFNSRAWLDEIIPDAKIFLLPDQKKQPVLKFQNK